MADWNPIETAPEGREVMTKVHDHRGEHKFVKLTRIGSRWYANPELSLGLYIHYMPTHWMES